MNSSSVKLTEANYYRNGGIRTTYWETFDIDALWYYLFIEKITLKNSSKLLHECHKIKEKLIELTSWRHILFLFVLFLNRIISQVAKWIFIYGPFELEFVSKLNYGYLFNMFCNSYGGDSNWCDLLPGDSVIQCRPNMEVYFWICLNWVTFSITRQIIMLITEASIQKVSSK